MTIAEALRQEGVEKGQIRGQRRILLRQLAKRFGTVPDDVVLQMNEADPEQLDAWAENLLSATTIEEVFNGKA